MKGCYMNLFKYLLGTLVLLLQTSLCFAGAENSVNILLMPDPITNCSTAGLEVAMTEHSTLNIVPQSCTSRPSVGLANNQVTNKFDRVGFGVEYYLEGALNGGYFVSMGSGVENVEYTSVAGSSAKVQFIDVAIGAGYQWIWKNGFNMNLQFAIAHLMLNSLDKIISPTESADVTNFLNQNTSTGTHPGMGFAFGWAF